MWNQLLQYVFNLLPSAPLSFFFLSLALYALFYLFTKYPALPLPKPRAHTPLQTHNMQPLPTKHLTHRSLPILLFPFTFPTLLFFAVTHSVFIPHSKYICTFLATLMALPSTCLVPLSLGHFSHLPTHTCVHTSPSLSIPFTTTSWLTYPYSSAYSVAGSHPRYVPVLRYHMPCTETLTKT